MGRFRCGMFIEMRVEARVAGNFVGFLEWYAKKLWVSSMRCKKGRQRRKKQQAVIISKDRSINPS